MLEENPLKRLFRHRPWLVMMVVFLFGGGAAMAFAPMLAESVVDHFHSLQDE